jgi:uncharacterized protein YcbK (DUF882 family)
MMRVVAPCFLMTAGLLVSSLAGATPPKPHKVERTARVQKAEPKTCTKPAVEIIGASAETATFSLARCDGSAAPQAVEQLSILARPASAAKPKESLEKLGRAKGPDLAPGVRRIDPRLVQRLELAVEHFARGAQPSKIQLYSGYRPKSAGSFHQSGRALDFRLEGVTNEALVAFCKTLPDTGCGYYPNSLFVHMDVRDAGAGHVAWIDVSKPGETPRYVTAWPPPAQDAGKLPALPAEPDEDTRASSKRPRDGHVYYF